MKNSLFEKAHQHFLQHDNVMAALALHAKRKQSLFTLPTPSHPDQYFQNVVTSIISQQISTKAAASIHARVIAELHTITTQSVLAANTEALRACGVSPQKIKYITHNAHVWHELPVNDFSNMDTEVVFNELTKLYGIGRWTAEMFCIFTLGRPDVFSRGDLGLMQSLYHYYHFKPHYTRKITATIAAWSPYQSVAALLLWHARDTNFVPAVDA